MNFFQVLYQLVEKNLQFVVIGGVASRLYGSTRLTHDIDIVPNLDGEEWGKLIHRLWELGLRPQIPETKQVFLNPENINRWMKEKNLLSISFRSERGDIILDLLVSESVNFDSLIERSNQVVINNATFFIASIDDLIVMKKKAGRPQDLLDIETLLQIKEKKK